MASAISKRMLSAAHGQVLLTALPRHPAGMLRCCFAKVYSSPHMALSLPPVLMMLCLLSVVPVALPPARLPGCRVLEVLYFMRSRWPNAHIILLALLPRGCEKFFGCEPAESGPGSQGRDFSYPSIFTPSITKVNVLLE